MQEKTYGNNTWANTLKATIVFKTLLVIFPDEGVIWNYWTMVHISKLIFLFDFVCEKPFKSGLVTRGSSYMFYLTICYERRCCLPYLFRFGEDIFWHLSRSGMAYDLLWNLFYIMKSSFFSLDLDNNLNSSISLNNNYIL